jgi:hypothetical protein
MITLAVTLKCVYCECSVQWDGDEITKWQRCCSQTVLLRQKSLTSPNLYLVHNPEWAVQVHSTVFPSQALQIRASLACSTSELLTENTVWILMHYRTCKTGHRHVRRPVPPQDNTNAESTRVYIPVSSGIPTQDPKIRKAEDILHLTPHDYKYLLFKITNFMELSPSRKAPVTQILKNFPTFYGTRRFITAFTRAIHWSLS